MSVPGRGKDNLEELDPDPELENRLGRTLMQMDAASDC